MLDTKSNKKQIKKYITLTLFFIVFSNIYELFSHEVFSGYMVYSFAFPLIGLIIYTAIYLTNTSKHISILSSQLFNSFILTSALGSVMKGVLDIYGTTNSLINYYQILGLILLITSIITNIISCIWREKIT